MNFNHTQYDQHSVTDHTNSAFCNFVQQQILICRSCEFLWWQRNDWHCNWLICVSSNYPIPRVPVNRNDVCIRVNIFFCPLYNIIYTAIANFDKYDWIIEYSVLKCCGKVPNEHWEFTENCFQILSSILCSNS
jgi:hypothetical protein